MSISFLGLEKFSTIISSNKFFVICLVFFSIEWILFQKSFFLFTLGDFHYSVFLFADLVFLII